MQVHRRTVNGVRIHPGETIGKVQSGTGAIHQGRGTEPCHGALDGYPQRLLPIPVRPG